MSASSRRWRTVRGIWWRRWRANGNTFGFRRRRISRPSITFIGWFIIVTAGQRKRGAGNTLLFQKIPIVLPFLILVLIKVIITGLFVKLFRGNFIMSRLIMTVFRFLIFLTFAFALTRVQCRETLAIQMTFLFVQTRCRRLTNRLSTLTLNGVVFIISGVIGIAFQLITAVARTFRFSLY